MRSQTFPLRWTLEKQYLGFRVRGGPAVSGVVHGDEVEVMPVAEHEALRESAQTVARALDGPTSELIDAVYDLRMILNGPDPEASLRDAARLVVDAEYRRERLGPDTVATFDRALGELRKAWERTG